MKGTEALFFPDSAMRAARHPLSTILEVEEDFFLCDWQAGCYKT